jgi:hypothetical protein
MQLGKAALRTRMTGPGGAMVPARSLDWFAQCALASEIALAAANSAKARCGAPSERRLARDNASWGNSDAK